ncbi:hypothetical protein [Streptomyces sp. NBC_00347]|uniref:hypothetical protein n=1 Tax=Streptomyces sp. NBC_00347 TaxID=2975721 RepID=UPI00224DA8AF|nr:hypothetical protein [Streptomyces sp. NBC_00347]MCX5129478.1 hypothetical protein [Streptomyces sp. NBC_00347]
MLKRRKVASLARQVDYELPIVAEDPHAVLNSVLVCGIEGANHAGYQFVGLVFLEVPCALSFLEYVLSTIPVHPELSL